MTSVKLRTKKALIRRQILNDIHEINTELTSLREILRMKQSLLRKTNQDIYKLSRTGSQLKVLQGGKRDYDILLQQYSEPADTASSNTTTLELLEGGRQAT